MAARATRARALASTASPYDSRRPGVILGVGLGGFVDGIALHQIAHWHDMGSARVPPTTLQALERNMVWDGLFHAGMWIITLVGLYLLLADARRGVRLPSARAFTGQLILGWGLFNVVEGIVDHHILELHHVHDLPVHIAAYDWVFLVVAGVGFVIAGWMMLRQPRAMTTWR